VHSNIGGWQVLKEVDFSAMAQEFIAQLTELRNITLERLLTTPLEVLQRKEFLEDVDSNTEKVNLAMANMNAYLIELAEDAEDKVCQ